MDNLFTVLIFFIIIIIFCICISSISTSGVMIYQYYSKKVSNESNKIITNLLDTEIIDDDTKFETEHSNKTFREVIDIFVSENGKDLYGLNNTIGWFVNYLNSHNLSYPTVLNDVLHEEFDIINITSPVDSPENEYLFKIIGQDITNWESKYNGRTVKEVIDYFVIFQYDSIESWFNGGAGVNELNYSKIKNYHERLQSSEMSEFIESGMMNTKIIDDDTKFDTEHSGKTYREVIDIFIIEFGKDLDGLNKSIDWFVNYSNAHDLTYTTKLNDILHTEFDIENITSPVDSTENQYLFKIIGEDYTTSSAHRGKTVKHTIDYMIADNNSTPQMQNWFNPSRRNSGINGLDYVKIEFYHQTMSQNWDMYGR